MKIKKITADEILRNIEIIMEKGKLNKKNIKIQNQIKKDLKTN